MKIAGNLGVVVVLLVAAAPFPARSQDSATVAPQAASPASDDSLAEITVTARRREENLSKVPISVAVIGDQQLISRSIQTENDLQSAVPGLTVRQNFNANSFSYAIRGQTIDPNSGSPPGVLPYIDEGQVISHSASAFYDLANIQVLKGPQGTLFGRNTTGGAVLFQTAQPDDTFGGYASGRYGNFGSHHEESAINLPISSVVKLRIAVSDTGGGAFVRDLSTGQEFGNLVQNSGRLTLLVGPVSGLTNTTVFQYSRDGGTNPPALAYHSSAYACGNGKYSDTADCTYGPSNPTFRAWIAQHPGVFPGGVVAYANLQDKLGPWDYYGDFTPFHVAASTFAINTTKYEISSDVAIKNIITVNRSWSDDANDYDGTPYPLFETPGTPTADGTSQTNQTRGFYQLTKQVSDELQLQGTALDKRLTYTTGLYYAYQRDDLESNILAYNFSPITPGSTFIYARQAIDKSYAGFAQATYALTDKLNLTGGIRYTTEKLEAAQLPGSFWTFSLPASNPYFPQHTSTSKPSWIVSLDYAVTPSLLAYATTRGSWRAGGFNEYQMPTNGSAYDGGNMFKPETTEDVEIGMKYNGRDLGIPVTFNIDFYNQWVSDIQRVAQVLGPDETPSQITVNVPKAQVTGVEADLSARPVSWLNIGGDVAYADARFTDNRVSFNPSFSTSVLLYGPYADAPRFSGSAYAELSKQLSHDSGTLTLRGDVFAESEYFFSSLNATVNPGATISGYALVNARLTWSELLGTRVTAAFFVRNMLNREYYAGGNAEGQSLGLNEANPGQPRMYGVEARVKF
jgi:iron complex outermembrane receptor protein